MRHKEARHIHPLAQVPFQTDFVLASLDCLLDLIGRGRLFNRKSLRFVGISGFLELCY